MPTLAFSQGLLLSPLHLLILLVLFALVGGLIFLIVWLANQSSAPPRHIPPPPAPDADLERRRKELELDRMAIENEERRRKLSQ